MYIYIMHFYLFIKHSNLFICLKLKAGLYYEIFRDEQLVCFSHGVSIILVYFSFIVYNVLICSKIIENISFWLAGQFFECRAFYFQRVLFQRIMLVYLNQSFFFVFISWGTNNERVFILECFAQFIV